MVSSDELPSTSGASGRPTEAADSSLQDAFLRWRISKQKQGPAAGHPPPPPPEALRRAFVDLARSYIGVPYARRYHEAAGCTCDGCAQSGRQLFHEPLFLDCCGLVRRVARQMQRQLGFRLGPGNQSYQFDTLPLRVGSVQELEPGDLIFYSGEYVKPSAQKKRFAFGMTHVEIFVGGSTGEATIGSRERCKWVMQYDSYRFVSQRWALTGHFFCKLDPWLRGACQPQHPELWQALWGRAAGQECARLRDAPGGSLAWDVKKYSIFAGGAQGADEDGEGRQTGDEDGQQADGQQEGDES